MKKVNLFSRIFGARAAARRRSRKIQKKIDKKTEVLVRAWVGAKGYCRSQQLEQAAESIGVGAEQLAYYFNKRGTTFTAWRKELRIEEAKALLVNRPGLPASRIGELVGIPDRSNFNKRFKEVTGLLPSEWRRLNAGK